MDGGAWKAAVHGVAKSQTRLSDFTFTIHFLALEEEMATHSSVLAWRIPTTAEPGGLPSMGSHRVRHDWSDSATQQQICRGYHPYSRKWRGTKELLDECERGEWKAGLKLNIHKTKITASGPITSQQIDGKTMETVTDFIFLGSKITGNGDCHHEIKRHLLLGRKTMTNLHSIFQSRDITLPTKVHIAKAMVFSVVM